MADRKVIVRGNPLITEAPLASTTEDVLPGFILQLASSGNTDGVAPADDADGTPEKLIAVNNQAKGMDIDEAYEAATDIANTPDVAYAHVNSGDVVRLRVKAGTAAFVYGATLAIDETNHGFVTPSASNVKFKALEDVGADANNDRFAKVLVI